MYGIQSDEFSERWAPSVIGVLRIVTALLFITHGTARLLGFPEMADMANPPMWSLPWIAGWFELIGGVAILLGAWTRWFGILLAVEMAVAYFLFYAGVSPFPLANGGEATILFCVIFLALAVIGAGEWSVDKMRARAHSDVWGYAAPGGERPGLDDE